MLVVDGAGENEIVCYWLIKSELKQAAETMLSAFMEFNPSWNKIQVVISK